ncbi:MAG: M4 family metallopeptidase [Phycisphaerae bacterium]
MRTACSAPSSYPDGVRWLMGEDATAFGGAIRDMWDPTCFGDPDYANSPLQTCPASDNGGVHSGSGIPNHAFAIMTDGKTYNGYTVSAIGPIKAGAVWYRTLLFYLTPASDFRDAYFALNQAATDLIGTSPNDPRTGTPIAAMFTAADAVEVDEALLAVEMNTDGACGATVDILDPNPPDQCSPRAAVFSDDFEGGTNGWTVSLTGTPDTPYNWVQVGSLPLSRPGTGWFCENLADGCPTGGEESAVHLLTSPVITMPAQFAQPTLAFAHYMASEAGYDGGNVKISVNSGAWELIPASAFTYNAYNTSLNGGDNTNPIAGEAAWSGAGGGWGTSLIDLTSYVTSGGDTVQFRFEFGKDYCNGVDGWYLDDFELYYCTCTIDDDCDDGLYCTGAETCVGGFCQTTGNPCGGDFCDEDADTCLPTVFWDDFENGNVNGWNFYAPGSTASTGDWVIGNPTGTSNGGDQAQPEDPFEGAGCAFTAQNTSLGTDDVDNGVVYLMSPAIDLSGADTADLSFVRWHYNRDLGEDSGDFFVADVSPNDGSSWVNLETLGTNQSANTWTPRSFSLDTVITLTSTVRIRFGAADGSSTGNIIESAIDNVVITAEEGCDIDDDCDDQNPCTDDVCDAGDCVYTNNTDPCDDGDDCTINDTCADGACESGPPMPCDDGEYCNGAETCVAGSCTSGTYPCGAQLCDEVTDTCVDCFGDGDCDDGEYCNGEETCVAGACVAGSAPCAPQICDEVNDTCDECVENEDCDDTLYCNGLETCAAGTCVAGVAPDCDDSVTCTVDTCDEGADVCVNTPDDGACDNTLFCDGNEWCDAATGCQPGTTVDCNDSVDCTTDSCDEDADQCANEPVNAACDDTLYCNGAETCDAISGCQPGVDVDCDDSVSCTVDTCDEGGDTCVNTPDDNACDNAVFCDGVETCDGVAGCTSGADPCPGQVCNEAGESCCPTTDAPGDDPVVGDIGFGTRNRYLTFVPGNSAQNTALRVTFSSLPGYEYAEGRTMWVQEPHTVTEASGSSDPTPAPTFWAAGLGCQPHYTDWSAYGKVDVYDDAVIPGATFAVQAIDEGCETAHAPSYSAALSMSLSAVGDVGGDCDVTPCSSPQGVVDFVDITAVVDKFKNEPDAVLKARADLRNSTTTLAKPDQKVDFVDISYCVEAFAATAEALPGPPMTDPCQ